MEGHYIHRLRVSHKEVRKYFRLNKKRMRDLIHNKIVFFVRGYDGEEIHVIRMLDVLDHILHKLNSPVILNLFR